MKVVGENANLFVERVRNQYLYARTTDTRTKIVMAPTLPAMILIIRVSSNAICVVCVCVAVLVCVVVVVLKKYRTLFIVVDYKFADTFRWEFWW